jgi:branched-chain amino acid aminotransferase
MGVVFRKSEFINEQDLVIKSSNRAFNYGDGFFETIKIINTNPFNFSAHYARFSLACVVLKLKNEETISSLLSVINNLINQNKLINGSVKIHISREEGGKYKPKSQNCEMMINTCSGLGFKQNIPISLCVFSDEVKTMGVLSNIKSVNAAVSVLGAIHAKELGFGNSILRNTKGNYIEVTNSSLFIVKDNVIYTPPLSDGCIDGTMRGWVLNNYKAIEKSLSLDDIKQSDEVFITNALTGITAVKWVEETGFTDFNYADKLQNKLINLSLDL